MGFYIDAPENSNDYGLGEFLGKTSAIGKELK